MSTVEVETTMCVNCNIMTDIKFTTVKHIDMKTSKQRFKQDNDFKKDDWFRCPRCLNLDISIGRSGNLTCKYCDLETQI